MSDNLSQDQHDTPAIMQENSDHDFRLDNGRDLLETYLRQIPQYSGQSEDIQSEPMIRQTSFNSDIERQQRLSIQPSPHFLDPTSTQKAATQHNLYIDLDRHTSPGSTIRDDAFVMPYHDRHSGLRPSYEMEHPVFLTYEDTNVNDSNDQSIREDQRRSKSNRDIQRERSRSPLGSRGVRKDWKGHRNLDDRNSQPRSTHRSDRDHQRGRSNQYGWRGQANLTNPKRVQWDKKKVNAGDKIHGDKKDTQSKVVSKDAKKKSPSTFMLPVPTIGKGLAYKAAGDWCHKHSHPHKTSEENGSVCATFKPNWSKFNDPLGWKEAVGAFYPLLHTGLPADLKTMFEFATLLQHLFDLVASEFERWSLARDQAICTLLDSLFENNKHAKYRNDLKLLAATVSRMSYLAGMSWIHGIFDSARAYLVTPLTGYEKPRASTGAIADANVPTPYEAAKLAYQQLATIMKETTDMQPLDPNAQKFLITKLGDVSEFVARSMNSLKNDFSKYVIENPELITELEVLTGFSTCLKFAVSLSSDVNKWGIKELVFPKIG